MNTKELIGKRIKGLRKVREMSQEELAEKMGISSNYLSRIERGTENPTLDTFIKMAEALGVEFPELFNYEHEKSSKELRAFVTALLKSSDEEKLKIAAKIVKAIYQ